jgi:hypothetical protein
MLREDYSEEVPQLPIWKVSPPPHLNEEGYVILFIHSIKP